MATGTFTYNALRTKTLKERIKTQNCKPFILDKSDAVSVGTTAIKPYLSICVVGLVLFARCCGKMYSRHLFSYGGLGHISPGHARNFVLSVKHEACMRVSRRLSRVHVSSFAAKPLGPRACSLFVLPQRGATLLRANLNHLRDFLPPLCPLFAFSKDSSPKSLSEVTEL